MHNVNKKSLVIYKVIFLKKARLVKRVLINFSQRINNLITNGLLRVVDYVRSSARYENKKKIYYKQLINQ